MTTDEKQHALAKIASKIIADDPLPQLRKGATQLVPGEGHPNAETMFIGEAPGSNEDRQGRPFVGAAGKFLEEMLDEIGLKREDVFITNIVKYQPPNNRDPLPEEIQALLPYLLAQIKIIQPKLIVFLGRHSMTVFLPELKISQAHGRPVKKGDQVYLPLFHPAAALYNSSIKQTIIEDFKKIPIILKKLTT